MNKTYFDPFHFSLYVGPFNTCSFFLWIYEKNIANQVSPSCHLKAAETQNLSRELIDKGSGKSLSHFRFYVKCLTWLLTWMIYSHEWSILKCWTDNPFGLALCSLKPHKQDPSKRSYLADSPGPSWWRERPDLKRSSSLSLHSGLGLLLRSFEWLEWVDWELSSL